MSQTKVWIEEGCITCDACEETSPEVFNVTDDTCVIRPEVDYKTFNEDIADAADGCPVDVIKYILDNGTTNVSDDAPGDSSGSAEEEVVLVEIDVEAGAIELPELEIEVRVFRYDPVAEVQGWDTFACHLPGHLSLLEALATLRSQDPSLAYRQGGVDDPTTALSLNGRAVLPGMVRLMEAARVRGNRRHLTIAPLDGRPVLRDLIVDLSSWERTRRTVGPGLQPRSRTTASTASGVAFATHSAQNAADVHALTEVASPHLLDGWSDSVPHAPRYIGPALCLRLWSLVADDRTGRDQVLAIRELLNDADRGMWGEADVSSLVRHGSLGQRTAAAFGAARRMMLKPSIAMGRRHDRHVWWFATTVKSSGTLNETALAAGTGGPLGTLGNLGVLGRMATGFTRTGRKFFWDVQGLFLGLTGKMPPVFNKRVDRHHEVVQLYNDMDQRF